MTIWHSNRSALRPQAHFLFPGCAVLWTPSRVARHPTTLMPGSTKEDKEGICSFLGRPLIFYVVVKGGKNAFLAERQTKYRNNFGCLCSSYVPTLTLPEHFTLFLLPLFASDLGLNETKLDENSTHYSSPFFEDNRKSKALGSEKAVQLLILFWYLNSTSNSLPLIRFKATRTECYGTKRK